MKTLKQLWFHRREKKKNKKKKKTKKMVSFPTEIIEDIVSRLPVKSILRCRSVSKTWLKLLSHPSFNKLQFNRATTTHCCTALFFLAEDYLTKKCYYFTAAKEGGPLTLLMEIDNDAGGTDTGPSQLNGGGLVYFTSNTWPLTPPFLMNSQAFVVNPATRKIFKLPDMNSASEHDLYSYLYGFDQSRNEYKILLLKGVFKTNKFEVMIFSMSSFSWRKIDVETPVSFDWRRLYGLKGGGVCLNSVVYTMLRDMTYDIFAFDFVAEKFSVISLPQAFFPDNAEDGFKNYSHTITKIDGCLGVVLHDYERSEIRIWLLQDYDKCLWVKETIKLSKSWNALAASPSIDVNMDGEIVFSMSKVTKNAMIIPVYNRKSKCFKKVQFTLDEQFASPISLRFRHIRCYVETIMPLVDNWSKTSIGGSD